MPYRVKDVGPSASGKTTSITLDAKNPTENYPDWRVSFDHTRNGPAPQTGMTIECEPVANAKGYYWINSWKPAQINGGPQQAATQLPEHVQQTINQDAPNFPEPPQAMNTVTISGVAETGPVAVNDKEVTMFVMGVIGRFLSGQNDFPVPEELRGMVVNARQAYQRGMTRDD